MQRSPLAALALAVLLVTAGCSGVFGGVEPSPQSPTTVDSDAANAVPGVENGEVTNATALFAAHDRGLVEAGFENDVQVNATVIQRNQTVRVQRQQLTIVESGRSEYQYRTVNGNGGGYVQFDHWGNESVWVIRGKLGDTTRYQVRNRVAATESLTGTALLRNYVNGSDARAVGVSEKNGLTLVTFESTTVPSDPDALPVNSSDISDYRARFVVDTEGRIHALVAEGSYDLRGEERDFRVTYDLKRLDDPDVNQPEWAAEALRNGSS